MGSGFKSLGAHPTPQVARSPRSRGDTGRGLFRFIDWIGDSDEHPRPPRSRSPRAIMPACGASRSPPVSPWPCRSPAGARRSCCFMRGARRTARSTGSCRCSRGTSGSSCPICAASVRATSRTAGTRWRMLLGMSSPSWTSLAFTTAGCSAPPAAATSRNRSRSSIPNACAGWCWSGRRAICAGRSRERSRVCSRRSTRHHRLGAVLVAVAVLTHDHDGRETRDGGAELRRRREREPGGRTARRSSHARRGGGLRDAGGQLGGVRVHQEEPELVRTRAERVERQHEGAVGALHGDATGHPVRRGEGADGQVVRRGRGRGG